MRTGCSSNFSLFGGRHSEFCWSLVGVDRFRHPAPGWRIGYRLVFSFTQAPDCDLLGIDTGGAPGLTDFGGKSSRLAAGKAPKPRSMVKSTRFPCALSQEHPNLPSSGDPPRGGAVHRGPGREANGSLSQTHVCQKALKPSLVGQNFLPGQPGAVSQTGLQILGLKVSVFTEDLIHRHLLSH